MSLEGKTAVVIGASGQHNFGVAIAKALANEGAKVIVSGRRQAPSRRWPARLVASRFL